MQKKILASFCFTVLFFLQSCDDFLLKKTVSVEYLEGEIVFEPQDPSLSGTLTYQIKNKQPKPLSEIYFISHYLLSIDSLSYNDDNLHFEQGVGFGSGIYHAKIPSLTNDETAKVEVKFHIKGNIEEDRFLLAKEKCYMDARKIWLPVPFADEPKFFYSLQIKTPEEYYSVLGAKITEESVKNGKRTTSWESEIDDVFLSGNLFISKFQRIQNGSSYFYTHNPEESKPIFEAYSKILSIMTNHLGTYPFSQLHIIKESFKNKDMEEFVDGEAMANIIQISPDLKIVTPLNEKSIEESAIPEIPRDSAWKIYETLSHEMSHAYIRGILRFEEDNYMESESLTEYMGLYLINQINPLIYSKFIQRNRIELINLELAGKRSTKQFQYLYGVNCLHTVFYGNQDYFNFLKDLIEKYSYTRIRVSELISTALELKTTNTQTNIEHLYFPYGLKLWGHYQLYDIRLSYSNVQVTNFINKKKKIEDRKIVIIENHFPLDFQSLLIGRHSDFKKSYWIELQKNSVTNFLLDREISSVKILSRLEALEKNLQDNKIEFFSDKWDLLYSNIQNFYSRQNFSKDFTAQKLINTPANWTDLYSDRERTLSIASNIHFLFDAEHENGDEFYLEAYKILNEAPFSYIIFRGKREKEKIKMLEMIDPAF
jgi:hypothetical protein